MPSALVALDSPDRKRETGCAPRVTGRYEGEEAATTQGARRDKVGREYLGRGYGLMPTWTGTSTSCAPILQDEEAHLDWIACQTQAAAARPVKNAAIPKTRTAPRPRRRAGRARGYPPAHGPAHPPHGKERPMADTPKKLTSISGAPVPDNQNV